LTGTAVETTSYADDLTPGGQIWSSGWTSGTSCCSTNCLFRSFIKRLSNAIFEWSAEDLEQAKRLGLMTQHMMETPTWEDIVRWMSTSPSLKIFTHEPHSRHNGSHQSKKPGKLF